MCRSKCFKVRTFDLGKDPSLILETEGSWEVLKENPSPPSPPWGARINWGNRQVVIENFLLSHPWSFGMLMGGLTLGFTSGLRVRIKSWGCLEQVLDTLSPSAPFPLRIFSFLLDYRKEDMERNFPAMTGVGGGGQR